MDGTRETESFGRFRSKFGIVNNIVDKLVISTLANGLVFPLHIYPQNCSQQLIGESMARTPNLDLEIINKIAGELGLEFTIEKEILLDTFAPIDLLDYIYAVLHSPRYREKYK